MPRTARLSIGGLCYHVINRDNAQAIVFHKSGDYQAFIDLMDESSRRLPMRILAYCLMPNHFHFLIWAINNGDLSRWMQWLMTTHVRSYHRHYGSSGHIWQGRFKSFPLASDEHLLTAHRYIEGNPLRAGLVSRAEEWPWSSLRWLNSEGRPAFLSEGPVQRPTDWLERVNLPLTHKELQALRRSVNQGVPFGDSDWASHTAAELGLKSGRPPCGRPRSGTKS